MTKEEELALKKAAREEEEQKALERALRKKERLANNGGIEVAGGAKKTAQTPAPESGQAACLQYISNEEVLKSLCLSSCGSYFPQPTCAAQPLSVGNAGGVNQAELNLVGTMFGASAIGVMVPFEAALIMAALAVACAFYYMQSKAPVNDHRGRSDEKGNRNISPSPIARRNDKSTSANLVTPAVSSGSAVGAPSKKPMNRDVSNDGDAPGGKWEKAIRGDDKRLAPNDHSSAK
ncbi:MAG: hypothetical protein ACHP6I_03560 [Rickettsiales bacterium]